MVPRMHHLESIKRIYASLRKYERTIIKFKVEIPSHEAFDTAEYRMLFGNRVGRCHEERLTTMHQQKGVCTDDDFDRCQYNDVVIHNIHCFFDR